MKEVIFLILLAASLVYCGGTYHAIYYYSDSNCNDGAGVVVDNLDGSSCELTTDGSCQTTGGSFWKEACVGTNPRDVLPLDWVGVTQYSGTTCLSPVTFWAKNVSADACVPTRPTDSYFLTACSDYINVGYGLTFTTYSSQNCAGGTSTFMIDVADKNCTSISIDASYIASCPPRVPVAGPMSEPVADPIAPPMTVPVSPPVSAPKAAPVAAPQKTFSSASMVSASVILMLVGLTF